MRPSALALALCLAAPPALADDLTARATDVFRAAFDETCYSAFLEDGGLIDPPQRFDLRMPMTYSDPENAVLWLFRCNIGAYNVQAVPMLWTEYDGIRPAPVTRPDLQVINEVPDDYESPVKELRILGWSASNMVVNPEFDAASQTLRATGYWRGMGDASDSSVWRLVDGAFRLVRFDVDASYDGEINPTSLLALE